MLEPLVSRLNGHSSSSGAVRIEDESDCIELLRKRLVDKSILTKDAIDQFWDGARTEAEQAATTALSEPMPTAADVPTHTYAPSPVDSVYPEDYTGLPE